MVVNLSFQEELDILIDSQLTATELFVIRLIYLACDDKPEFLKNYISSLGINGKSFLRQVLESLVNKKVINSTFVLPKEGEALNVKNIPFNKNFLKKYIRESGQLGHEIFDCYPPFISINGKMCSIKNITKGNLYSIEEFCVFYAKAIKNASTTHERVMSALMFGKENNLIHYSILEFIASKKWEEIEYIRDSGNINGYSNSELI